MIYKILDDAALGFFGDRGRRRVSSRRLIQRHAGQEGAHGGQAFFDYSTNFLIDFNNTVMINILVTTTMQQTQMLDPPSA